MNFSRDFAQGTGKILEICVLQLSHSFVNHGLPIPALQADYQLFWLLRSSLSSPVPLALYKGIILVLLLYPLP